MWALELRERTSTCLHFRCKNSYVLPNMHHLLQQHQHVCAHMHTCTIYKYPTIKHHNHQFTQPFHINGKAHSTRLHGPCSLCFRPQQQYHPRGGKLSLGLEAAVQPTAPGTKIQSVSKSRHQHSAGGKLVCRLVVF